MAGTDEIRPLARLVREAVMQSHREFCDAGKHCPACRTLAGCCGGAARLLREVVGGEVVVGYFADFINPGMPHAWVEVDGLLVDITATQFSTGWLSIPRDGVLIAPIDHAHNFRAERRGHAALAEIRRWKARAGNPPSLEARIYAAFDRACELLGMSEAA